MMISLNRLLPAMCAAIVFPAWVWGGEAAGADIPGKAASVQEAGPAGAVRAPVLQIGAGDQVRVEVFGSPDVNTTTYVADDGTIRVPLAGAVRIGGDSPTDAALKIEAALKAGEYLVDPQVTVTVVQSVSQRVSVLGEVRSPGRYPIEANTTVFDVIALAGGTTDKGGDRIYILRTDDSGKLQRLPVDLRDISGSGAGTATVQTLQGGDSVVVPKGTFFITGEVRSPGEYRVEGDMMLFEAVARAGGVTERGSASRVEVKRRGADDQYFEVAGKKNLRIEPGDVIRVKERIF